MARMSATNSYDTLVAQVRSGPPSLLRPFDAAMNTVEYFIHHEDVRRGAGDTTPRPPDEVAELEEALWRSAGRGSYRSMGSTGLDLVHGDGRIAHVRPGTPTATLTGRPGEITLYLSGRKAAAHVELGGPARRRRRPARRPFRHLRQRPGGGVRTPGPAPPASRPVGSHAEVDRTEASMAPARGGDRTDRRHRCRVPSVRLLAILGVTALAVGVAGSTPRPAAAAAGVARTALLPRLSAAAGDTLSLLAPPTIAGPTSPFKVRLGISGHGRPTGLTVDVTVYAHLVNPTEFDETLGGSPVGAVMASSDAIPVSSLPSDPQGGVDLSVPVTAGGVTGAASGPFTADLNCPLGSCGGVYPVQLKLTDTATRTVTSRLLTYLVYTDPAGRHRAPALRPGRSPGAGRPDGRRRRHRLVAQLPHRRGVRHLGAPGAGAPHRRPRPGHGGRPRRRPARTGPNGAVVSGLPHGRPRSADPVRFLRPRRRQRSRHATLGGPPSSPTRSVAGTRCSDRCPDCTPPAARRAGPGWRTAPSTRPPSMRSAPWATARSSSPPTPSPVHRRRPRRRGGSPWSGRRTPPPPSSPIPNCPLCCGRRSVADPALAADQILAEFEFDYYEAQNTPRPRGVVVAPPADRRYRSRHRDRRPRRSSGQSHGRPGHPGHPVLRRSGGRDGGTLRPTVQPAAGHRGDRHGPTRSGHRRRTRPVDRFLGRRLGEPAARRWPPVSTTLLDAESQLLSPTPQRAGVASFDAALAPPAGPAVRSPRARSG